MDVEGTIRLSVSPAGTPTIVHGPSSPTKSVYLDMDDATPIARDYDPRRRNFFDDSSEDEVETADELGFGQRVPRDPSTGKRPLSLAERKEANYLGARPSEYSFVCGGDNRQPAYAPGAFPESSYDGSTEDLHGSKQKDKRTQSSTTLRGPYATSLRIPDAFEDDETHSSYSRTDENILGVHAITLQALLRDGEGLHASTTRRKSMSSDRRSRNEREPDSSSPPPIPVPAPPKKISLALPPPPIDAYLRPPRSEEHKVLRTPYPFSQQQQQQTWHQPWQHQSSPYQQQQQQKQQQQQQPQPRKPSSPKPSPLSITTTPTSHPTILTLTLRRRPDHISPRMGSITIPADLRTSSTRTSSSSRSRSRSSAAPSPLSGEKGGAVAAAAAADFDDARFFAALRSEYARLAGPWRRFSARRLARITVGHASAWAGSACLHHSHNHDHYNVLGNYYAHNSTHNTNNLSNTTTNTTTTAASSCGGVGGICGSGGVANITTCPVQRAEALAQCSGGSGGACLCPPPPRFLTSRGLAEQFSEESLWRLYRGPRAGRRRFAWVHWAQRLAMQGLPHAREGGCPVRNSVVGLGLGVGVKDGGSGDADADTERGDGASEGAAASARRSVAALEFVEAWAAGRVVGALAAVLALAAAAVVLWVVLGPSEVGHGSVSAGGVGGGVGGGTGADVGVVVLGFRGAGSRVGTAVLVALGVLLAGWTVVAAWCWGSWVVG
ncbi:uncharacterized protein K452DRAFT_8620 [Aplosporella prunicola CBS 121167]|uniref:Uncharacterized protein n=1 Tax=Aplosporella prunicola CBS 121167 TaxID=1176127 RepID=A0A6A6BXF7_9PEZI|nr:uncharacterized protein K452DRAFT_8620 [Aplosporella prunicola CBS 121167]KAF2147534.1 hypothetical protein K452DRAFT_8620 [Aplosporella prunicola CBS 121167]